MGDGGDDAQVQGEIAVGGTAASRHVVMMQVWLRE